MYKELEMFLKVRRMKNKIDDVLWYVILKSRSLCISRFQKQKMELIDYVRNVENFECIYEMFFDILLQFLNLLK